MISDPGFIDETLRYFIINYLTRNQEHRYTLDEFLTWVGESTKYTTNSALFELLQTYSKSGRLDGKSYNEKSGATGGFFLCGMLRAAGLFVPWETEIFPDKFSIPAPSDEEFFIKLAEFYLKNDEGAVVAGYPDSNFLPGRITTFYDPCFNLRDWLLTVPTPAYYDAEQMNVFTSQFFRMFLPPESSYATEDTFVNARLFTGLGLVLLQNPKSIHPNKAILIKQSRYGDLGFGKVIEMEAKYDQIEEKGNWLSHLISYSFTEYRIMNEREMGEYGITIEESYILPDKSGYLVKVAYKLDMVKVKQLADILRQTPDMSYENRIKLEIPNLELDQSNTYVLNPQKLVCG